MKTNTRLYVSTLGQAVRRTAFFIVTALLFGGLFAGCADHLSPGPVGVVTLATGLLAPLGVEADAAGRVFVAEAGTGKNDGRISLISNGRVLPVVTGFDSQIYQGEVDGLGHLLVADGLLYAIHSNGKLYKINLAAYKTGDAPMSASSIPAEDISPFVIAQTKAKLITDNPDAFSHPYHMAIGPGGDMFIADAGANAIVRRNRTTGALSLFANIPGIKNPTPVGPPFIQSVPTGISYDGNNLLVSGLMGFPFPAGAAQVYQVTPAGVVSVRQAGFNSLTGLDAANGLIGLEYGTFGQRGWDPKTGRLVRAGSPANTVLTGGLNQPTALERITANSYFVVSLGDASLLKVTF